MTEILSPSARWARLASTSLLTLALAACGGGGDAVPPPAAPPVSGPPTLKVTKSGAGQIRSQPAGIDCGTTCEASYDANNTVTLTATPDAGQSFSGWGGECAGAAATCTVVMSQARSVSAAFTPIVAASHTLNVSVNGNGQVTSQPAGISCGSTCAANYVTGTTVTLTATPGGGQTLTGWGGACTSNTGTCVVSMTQARNVVASFAVQTAALAWGTAQLLESSNDFNVSALGSVWQVNAIAPNGNAMVIWQQSDGLPNGSVAKVFSRLYIAGQGWQPAVRIPDLSDFANRQIVGGKLFLSSQGVATLVRPNMDIRRYTVANGWTPFVIPPNKPTGSGSLTGGVMDASGNISLVSTGTDVYSLSISAAGQFSPWIRVSAGLQDADDADVAISSNGTSMAVWAEKNPGDSNNSVKAALRTSAGWQTPVTIESSFDNVHPSTPPVVAMDASGNAIAVWRQGPTNAPSIWAAVYTPQTGWASPTPFDTGALGSVPTRLRLAMASNGRAVISWQSGQFAIKTVTYAPGAGFGTPVVANTYGLDRELGIDDQGNAVLVYTAVNQWPNPTSTEVSVYSRRLVWGQTWSNQVLLETRPGSPKGGLAVAFNRSGAAVASWAQNDLATSDVRNSLWSNLLR